MRRPTYRSALIVVYIALMAIIATLIIAPPSHAMWFACGP